MFSSEIWGTEMRDVGYLHARAGAAQALLLLGDREQARQAAEAELADVRVFGAPRALGVALRAAGLGAGRRAGLELLNESVAGLRGSPARAGAGQLADRARSGATPRRPAGRSREPLAEALDLAAAAAPGRSPAAAREELKATGARPGAQWRTRGRSADPQRAADRAAGGRGPHQPRDRPGDCT